MKKYSVFGIISLATSSLGFIIMFGNNISDLILKDRLPYGNWEKSIEYTAITYLLLGLITAIVSIFFKNVKKTIPLFSFGLIIVLIGSAQLIKYLDKEPTIEEKIKKLTEQIKQNPNNDSLYLERATLYASSISQNYDSLIDLDLAKAYSLGCRSKTFYLARAIRNFHPGKYEQAVDDFTILINSYNHNAYFLRGRCYMGLRNYEPAINDFIQGMKIDNSKDYNYDIAECYELLGQYQTAIEHAQQDNKYQDRGYIARCMVLLGDYKRVVNYLNDSIVTENKYGNLYRIRGMSYYKLKMYDKAINDLKNSIQYDSKSFISEYFLSVVYAAEKDKSNAFEHLNQAYKKGFGFTDILTRNANFQKYRHDPQFINICSDYSKNSDTTNMYLHRVIIHDYIKGNKELKTILDRVAILLFEKDMREEFNKLNQLIHIFSI